MNNFIFRRPGTNPMAENRRDSKERVNVQLRRLQVLSALKELKQASAREIAVAMFDKGWVNTSERNNAAPRLNELVKTGQVEPVGKKFDNITGRNVTVFKIREGEM
jgi:hypothetical protein